MTHSKESLHQAIDSFKFAECLHQCHIQLSWLKSLFLVIQNDPDIEPGLHLHDLAQIGEHLSEKALSYIDDMHRDLGVDEDS